MKKTNSHSRITRRGFIGTAASATAFTIVPRHVLAASGETAPGDKLNVACLGVGGGMGYANVRFVSTENIVALCDVDEQLGAGAFEKFPKAKRYSDFRRLLDKEEKNIDAIVVTTADHTHILASMMAMRMGKHVYCEKPLGQNIHEIRVATEMAAKTKLATQMGNIVHSGSNYRSMAALIKAGTIGEVREVHCWANKWSSGESHNRPADTPPVPKHLNWDLFLGPAPVRPYHAAYHPNGWKFWWDFGNGAMGDMAPHIFDLAFTALDLEHPLTAEAQSAKPAHKERTPGRLICKLTFPKRGDLPPVELTWYDGGTPVPLQIEHKMPDWPEGSIFVGSEGMLIVEHTQGKLSFKLYPEDKFAGVEPPKMASSGHAQEWITACKTGSPTSTHFGYSGPLSEASLLGNVAYRVGKKIEWDPVNMKATNAPEADQFIQRENREGWTL